MVHSWRKSIFEESFVNGLRIPAAVLLVTLALSSPTLAAIETVDASGIEALIKSTPGILVLSLSSTDPKCQPCAGANSKFQVLALGSNTARFVQVVWQPWRDFPAPVRDLLTRYNLPNSVPIRLSRNSPRMQPRLRLQ
jgi:hypothetical protein